MNRLMMNFYLKSDRFELRFRRQLIFSQFTFVKESFLLSRKSLFSLGSFILNLHYPMSLQVAFQ